MNTKKVTVGLLAHVDTGKTTLAEQILYQTGQIHSVGRVDHRDTFFDTEELERKRGITIFSKTAQIPLQNITMYLIDTPGHIDFSPEMERALSILDYAVLLISGTEGVQSHTKTLWYLLKRYQIPTFLFLNKMDRTDQKQRILEEITTELSDNCIDFSSNPDNSFWEQIALCSEEGMQEYLSDEWVTEKTMSKQIRNRQLFPIVFGSALLGDGVTQLLHLMEKMMIPSVYEDTFGALVYKIAHENSQRLTFLKVSGGRLQVKEMLGQEKINEIRIYQGERYQTVRQVEAGDVCAVVGLNDSAAGQGYGNMTNLPDPELFAVVSYQLRLPEGSNPTEIFGKLKELEEEEPQLSLSWQEKSGEIQVKLMGEVQQEILRHLIKERFGLEVTFDPGSVLYLSLIHI